MAPREDLAPLRQAVATYRTGDRPAALRIARTFAADARCVGVAATLCGRLLFALGDVDAALAAMDRAPVVFGTDAAVPFEYRQLFGRYREAVLGIGARANAEMHARAADLLERRGDRDEAVEHLRRAHELEPRSLRIRMALADALDSHDEVTSLLDGVVAAKAGDPAYLGAASRIALGAGAFAQARLIAERLLALDPSATAAHDVLGHLDLFHGDTAPAFTHGTMLLAAGEPALGHLLCGAAHALGGRDDEALVDLEAAAREDDQGWEAHVWIAEILLRRGAVDAARRAADRAISGARGFLLSARLVRLLSELDAAPDGGGHTAGAAYRDAGYREIEEGVRALRPADESSPAGETARERTRLLREGLATLRGNRTLMPSRFEAGELVPVRVQPGPRWASRRVLGLIATRSEGELLARFDRVIAENPTSGLPLAHRGEANLWLGHYAAARSDLESVIARFPYSRWAYIGLATVDVVEGEHARALDVLATARKKMDDTEGPGVHGIRGEALRRLGRPLEAIAPLEHACAVSPRRVAAWINLALSYEAVGRGDDARRTFAQLLERAYPLLYDAARTLGAELDGSPSDGRVLEQALASLLGNRSASVITWRVGASPVRSLTDTSSAATIERARARELAQVHAGLVR